MFPIFICVVLATNYCVVFYKPINTIIVIVIVCYCLLCLLHLIKSVVLQYMLHFTILNVNLQVNVTVC